MRMCRNVGCNKAFKWPMQLYRHILKCSKPVVDKTNQIVDTTDGYQCAKCGRKYKFKENVYRHFKICKQVNYRNKELKKDYRCFKCQRQFFRKDYFESHVKQCTPINEQRVRVDTSSGDSAVLVVPTDYNLLPHDGNTHCQSNHTNTFTGQQEYVYEPKYIPTSSHSFEAIPSSSHHVLPSWHRPFEDVHNLSHAINLMPETSQHIGVIPTSCRPVERHSCAVDVKTVIRRTCSTCGRVFVRRDHYQRHISKCASHLRLPAVQSFTCSTCERKYQRRDHFERHTEKCAQLKPWKEEEGTEQNHNNNTSVTIDSQKPNNQLNAFLQSPGQGRDTNYCDIQDKFGPEIIESKSNPICNHSDVSKCIPSTSSSLCYSSNRATTPSTSSSLYHSSNIATTPSTPSSLYYSSNRNTTNYLWLKPKPLQGTSKVTIINNIKKVNNDRSRNLQNLTDKMMNNLTKERTLSLESIFGENINQSSNDMNTIHTPERNINEINHDRSHTLQNKTEKLLENYSNELSNMDFSEFMLNKKKKDATKDSQEPYKSLSITENIDTSDTQQLQEGATTMESEILADNEQQKNTVMASNLHTHDIEQLKCTIKVEKVDSTVEEIHNDTIMVENIDSDVIKEHNSTIKMESIDSATWDDNTVTNIKENIDSPSTDQQKSTEVGDVESSSDKIPGPDDLLSMFTQNHGDSLLKEKEDEFENDVCSAVIDYLKRLYLNNHSHFQFHKMMRDVFQEKLNDQQFVCWLYKKLL